MDDFTFLSDFHSTFKGLSSVKQLAFRIVCIFKKSDRRTWWGRSEESNQVWKGGNKKTEAAINLLEVTDQLETLEISTVRITRNPGDTKSLYTSFLSHLQSSFHCLKFLRLVTIEANPDDRSSTDLSKFKNLKLLAAEEFSLLALFEDTQLPDSFNIFPLPYYVGDMSGPAEKEFEEDTMIGRFLSLETFRTWRRWS